MEEIYLGVKVEGFEEMIKKAMELKVEQHPQIAQLLKENNLPFDHYYVYGSKDKYKIVDAGFKWVIEKWKEISKKLKE